jgi:glycosyltransferase involved in cell wall biosynthesis
MINRNDSSRSTAVLVSVVLPVYNCPAYIGAAIKSILNQTFENFELIVIDDGSTDNTPEIIQTFLDTRIRFFQQPNQGLAATLNRGISLARGKYIARHDQDDIALPERLAKQVKFLDSQPACGMVGTWAEIYLEETKTPRAHRHPSDNLRLQYELLFNNPFVHSSMLLRKSALEQVGGYSTDRERQPPEDYELWSRIAHEYEIANLPEILQIYREVPRSMSRTGVSPFLNHLVTISAENIAWAAKTAANDPSPVNLAALIHNAQTRLLGEPNFQLMSAVLQKAVAHVSQNDARLEREASHKVEQLKQAYLDAKNPGPKQKLIHYLRRVKHKFLKLRKPTG